MILRVLPLLLALPVLASSTSLMVEATTDSPSGNTTTEFIRQSYLKNDEGRLIEDLLHGYKARGAGLSRPVADYEERLKVTLKFQISEYEGINDVSKRMRLAGILRLTWKDIYLKWDPANYGNLDVIPLRGDNIYLPVIIRQSSAAEMSAIFSREGGMASLIWINYEGNVYATVAGIFNTDCQIDFEKFPFDTQVCDFVFQVWQHSIEQLVLRLDKGADVSMRAASSATQAMWQIDNIRARETVLSYDIGNFSALVYSIQTSRRSVYYIWNLVVPCFLLSTVQLAAFFMPYSPERVMFAITLVLSLHLFQESVARQLPATAEPIPIVKYSGSQMMIGILVTIESVFMLYFLEILQRRRVPLWLRKLRNTIYTRGRLLIKFREDHDDKQLEAGLNDKGLDVIDKDTMSHAPSRSVIEGSRQSSRVNLRDRQAGIMTTEEKDDREDEWRDTILMVDRAIFFICLAATIAIPASVFLKL